MGYEKIKVLVFDDMMTMRAIISNACREVGFKEIVEAADGQAAWKRLNEENANFGLIISDWNMPHASGLDLLKMVRGDARLKHLPFMIVTAESELSQVSEALKSGVDGYIVKPFNGATLQTKLTDCMNKAAKRVA